MYLASTGEADDCTPLLEGEAGGCVGREEQDTAAASSLTLGEALLPRAREEVEVGRGAWGGKVGEWAKGLTMPENNITPRCCSSVEGAVLKYSQNFATFYHL